MQFWRFSSGGQTKHIYWCALLIGLAWMIKGPAGLLYLPGFALFLLLRSQTLSRRRILHIALAGGILAVIIASWLLIAGKYGKIGIDKSYGKGNALHTMFIEDIWHRMTSSDFQGGQPRNYFFFFETLDSKVNLWNYLFYLSLAVGIVFLVRKRNAFISWLRDAGRGAYLLAACTLVPVFILLTFAANKYDWYLAPVFWIVCLFTARGIVYLQRRWPKLIWLFGAVAVFGYARQLVQINGYAENACWIKTGLMKQADTIIVVGDIPQDIMLQLKWSEKPVVRRELDKLAYEQGQKLIVSDSLTGGIREKMNVLPFTTRGMLFGRPID